jgi:polysaccharide export outer membrane protein
MRLRRLLVMLLAVLALAGCARARYAQAPAAPAVYSELDVRMYGAPAQPSSYVPRAPARSSYVVQRVREVVPVAVEVEEGPYTLDAGDKLRIVVFGQDALSNNYIVDAEGRIAFPLVGTVNARGATTSQLAAAIRSQLSQGFIRDPSVAVEIETYRPFFVLGEVTYPGQYPYVPNMTVENAIAIAGGFTPRGFKDKVTVTRKIQGMPTRLILPLRNPVRPGDTITVTERWF